MRWWRFLDPVNFSQALVTMAKNGGVGVSVNRSLAGKLGPGQVAAVTGQLQASAAGGVTGQQGGGAAKGGVAAAAGGIM